MRLKKLNHYVEILFNQDNVAPPHHHTTLPFFKLYLNVKFPLIRLLQFLSDLKDTIIIDVKYFEQIKG